MAIFEGAGKPTARHTWRSVVAAFLGLTVAACGSADQIHFVADKAPAPGTVTLVEGGFAKSSTGGVVFVDAMVVDSKPIIDLKFDLAFDHQSFGVVNVELGSFFPTDGQLVAPANKEGLLTWKLNRTGWNESVLHVEIAQDPAAGAPIQVSGKQKLFTVTFNSAEAGSATSPLKVMPTTLVRDGAGETLYTFGATVRSGTLKTE